MIFHPGKPTKVKKAIYLVFSTILGILLSFIAHAIIEINYLKSASAEGRIVPFYGGCALSPALQIGLLAAGIIAGFFLGRFWWRKIYIERIWGKKGSLNG